MGVLEIHLQEGFADDRVMIGVNGREVYRTDLLTTKALIGVADSVRTEVSSGHVEIVIDLPLRSLSGRLSVELEDQLYVGVSLIGGRIVFDSSAEPFGYA